MKDLNLFERAGYNKKEADKFIELCDKSDVPYDRLLNVLRKLNATPTTEEVMSVMAKALNKHY